MDKKNFFVTTPIYYSNGIPHIGHSYASLIADIIAKYKKISGYNVKFSTGVDENSQKVVEKALEASMEVMEYADLMASKHKAVWDGLNIAYTDFIRTTDPKHHKLVQEVLNRSYEAGDIYQGEYEGLYCIGCESFKKPSDLNEQGCCPDHLTKPQVIKEKNWFFKLSKYQDFIEKLYSENPDFVLPAPRFNEVKEFVKGGLEDFSISRESNKFGIPLPFDQSQVTYVWYDALFNYVTVCQDDMSFWPADLHIVGKDIIRFHAIFWPAMLKSAGYEMPKNILTTGFFTINGQKISKSLDNVIDPVEFSNKHSRDLMLLYLLSAFNIGQDGDFSEEQAITMYNARLANNIGNLLNRVIVLGLKIGGELKRPSEGLLGNIIQGLPVEYKKITELFDKYDLKGVLDKTFELCDTVNVYTNQNEPWKMISDGKIEEANEVLYTIAEGLRVAAVLLYPFFTGKMSELLTRIGLEDYPELLEKGKMEELLTRKETFKIKEKGEALYPRIG